MAEKKVQRRLGAVLAADVVGYSRLIGEDEAGTRERFISNLQDVIEPAIDEHQGRIVKTLGDGLLGEFASVVDAVECAVAIQKGMQQRNADKPADRRMDFRIGVNLGDLIIEDDDIHGDGVNVAARIEGLAEPGGICISRSARDQIRDRLSYELEDLGEIEVKNIARPIRTFRIVTDQSESSPPRLPARNNTNRDRWPLYGLVVAAVVLMVGTVVWLEPWTPRVAAASLADMRLPLPDEPSVAVLPFDVTSSGEGDRAFADAINEDLTRGLARVSGLFVIARSSTLDYVGEKAAPARVAEELGVRHVVRASLRRSGNRVRVDAELADAISGRIVWSDRFDHASADLFTLQDDLVQALASRLAQDLTKIADQYRFTQNVEAYFSWFQGYRESWVNTPASFGKARALALEALDREPNFVRAQALLAFVDTQTGYFKLADNPEATLERAHRAATAAVKAQPDDWYTNAVYAQTLINLRNYEGAVTAYERAIELEPANVRLLTLSALPLIFLGRGQEAEARLRIAIRLNPFHDWLPDQLLGQALYVQQKYQDAETNLAAARHKNPRFIGNLWWRAATYGQLDKTDEARKTVEEILGRMPDASISRSFIRISEEAAMERFRQGLRKAGLPE